MCEQRTFLYGPAVGKTRTLNMLHRFMSQGHTVEAADYWVAIRRPDGSVVCEVLLSSVHRAIDRHKVATAGTEQEPHR
jgi:hypothetical protein